MRQEPRLQFTKEERADRHWKSHPQGRPGGGQGRKGAGESSQEKNPL